MISLKTKDWEINNIETIIFDKDGTFIDLHYFWGKMTELRAKEIVRRYNTPAGTFEKLCAYLGYNLETGKMYPDGITALYSRSKIIEIFREKLLDEKLNLTTLELEEIFDTVSENFYKNITEFTMPIPSAIEFIKKVHTKGVKLGIVTSDSIISTNLTLERFGWKDLFSSVVGRESSNETKESGEPTKLALKELGANPETTVMIGDAPMDLISATNAGIERTILVATGQINKAELLKHSVYVVNSLKEVNIL